MGRAFIPDCECCQYCGFDPCECLIDEKCKFGGTIAPPTGTFGNYLNGNVAGTNGRGNVEVDVLDIIDGTPIKANDIHGFQIGTWGASGVNGPENRQTLINVNGVNSPMFHGSRTPDPAWICTIMSHGNPASNGGRTEHQVLRYMNEYYGSHATNNKGQLRPFVSTANPPAFTLTIRPNDNHASVVTSIMLLAEDGGILGVTSYSTLDANGAWSRLESFVDDCICGLCDIDDGGDDDDDGDDDDGDNDDDDTENGNKTYVKEDHTIEYVINNSWVENGQHKQTVQITITNTGNKVIANWMLAYHFNGDIDGIWNAAVVKTENLGLDFIRNLGYNAVIRPGQSETFGYILTSVRGAPIDIVMCQERVLKTDGYAVSLNVLQSWFGGFNGEIVLENTTDKPIEWWDLTFNTNFTITQILSSWAAELTINGNDNYTFKGTYTGIVEPHSSVRLGFTAATFTTPEIYAEELYEFVVNETLVFTTINATPTNYKVYDGWLFYSESGDGVTIHGFVHDNYDPALVIPASINGKTVAKIGVGAFAGTNITSVTFPTSGLTNIESFAFEGCMKLESVTIPGSVKEVWTGAFASSGITSVVFMSGNTGLRVELMAFSNCAELTEVVIHDRVNREITFGNYVFMQSGLVTAAIGEGATAITVGMFANCEDLVNVTFPSSLTSVAGNAFDGCVSLDEAFLEMLADMWGSTPNIEGIDGCCDRFEIERNTVIKYHGDCADVVIPSRNVGVNVTAIGFEALRDNANMETVIIPHGVTRIGERAFTGNINLKYVEIPGSVTNINAYAFMGCENLERVIFLEGSKPLTIWDAAFADTGLTAFSLPSRVETIRTWAFSGTSNLRTLEIGTGVTIIPLQAFIGSGLWQLRIPNNVEVIGGYAFADSNELKTVSIGTGTKTIVDGAFSNCVQLEAITVDEKNSDFSNDEYGVLFDKHKTLLIQFPIGRNIDGYVIPDSVIKISRLAFNKSVFLETVTFRGTAPPVIVNDKDITEDDTFEDCSRLKAIFVPVMAVNDYKSTMPARQNIIFGVEFDADGNPIGFCFECWQIVENCECCDECEKFLCECPICTDCGERRPNCVCVQQECAVCNVASKWRVITSPTCKEAGVRAKDCNCANESVTPLGHTISDEWEIIEPTRTQMGLKTKRCTVCNDVLERLIMPILPCENCEKTDCDYCGFCLKSNCDCGCEICEGCKLKECEICLIHKVCVMLCPLGDVNGDGKINTNDALEILKYIVGMNSSISVCNCNIGNGCSNIKNCSEEKINSCALRMSLIDPRSKARGTPDTSDALEILKFMVKLEGELSEHYGGFEI